MEKIHLTPASSDKLFCIGLFLNSSIVFFVLSMDEIKAEILFSMVLLQEVCKMVVSINFLTFSCDATKICICHQYL